MQDTLLKKQKVKGRLQQVFYALRGKWARVKFTWQTVRKQNLHQSLSLIEDPLPAQQHLEVDK